MDPLCSLLLKKQFGGDESWLDNSIENLRGIGALPIAFYEKVTRPAAVPNSQNPESIMPFDSGP